MYLDYILFAIGLALFVTAGAIALVLWRTRGSGQKMREVVDEETRKLNVFDTMTSRKSEAGATGSRAAAHTTEKVSPWKKDRSGTELDTSVLEGKYNLDQEIHQGNMSRVFLAYRSKMGDKCVVKFIEKEHVDLADEAEILKKVGPPYFPKILSILRGKQGLFLAESYVEGYSLYDTIEQMKAIGERFTNRQVCDWGIQMAQALHLLHNLDTPIYHCDMKPSNVMVTNFNRLVLVDFGISKWQGGNEEVKYATYAYAAPEQLRGGSDRAVEIIQKRFGELPPESAEWRVDERTDLYSLGVILYELLTGKLPEKDTVEEVSRYATDDLAGIVRKCLSVQPKDRYRSADELTSALESAMAGLEKMPPRLMLRRAAAIAAAAALAGGLASTASAAFVNQTENAAVITMDPCNAVVSQQESVRFLVEKQSPDGESAYLEPDRLHWSYSEDNIARIDGDRLVGINVGTTTLYGQYRDKVITLNVEVTEPVEETTSVSLRYPDGVHVSVYAGSGQRDFMDGSFQNCAFVSPASLDRDGDTLYLADSGRIRLLRNGQVSTVLLTPNYFRASMIRHWDANTYILTGAWEEDDGTEFYSLLRYRPGDEAEVLYSTEVEMTAITDFAFSGNGTLWYIQSNFVSGTTALYTLDTGRGQISWVMDLPDGASRMAFDPSDNLYISVPERGIILRVGKGENTWSYFAGQEDQRNFVDGALANFYRPTSLFADGESLYVLDFDTVRRISVQGAAAVSVETLAGVPTADTSTAPELDDGSHTVFPASELATLAPGENGRILLTDPKNSVIYQIVPFSDGI